MNNKEIRKVFVVGTCFIADIIAMLLTQEEGNAQYRKADNFSDADIVLFTGGADISPALYGEKALPATSCDTGRDTTDIYWYRKARKEEKFIVGICRGAQLINVMNGGTLWQHVSCHATGEPHLATDLETNTKVLVSSLHHQECIVTDKAIPLLIAHEAGYKLSHKLSWRKSMNPDAQDMEAFWYPDTFCLGFQPHPEVDEWGSSGRNLFFNYIDRFYEERKTYFSLQGLDLPKGHLI